MTARRASAAVFLLGLGTPALLAAQERGRGGVWFEAGVGAAEARVACSTCTTVTRSGGSAAYLRLGGSVSPGVLLGVEAYSLIHRGGGDAAGPASIVSENASLAAIVLWYPWSRRFFVKAGAGMANGSFTVNVEDADPVLSEGTGVGLTAGAGLDQPLWRGLALTANAGVWITAIGDVVLPARTIDDVIASLYTLSIGITIR